MRKISSMALAKTMAGLLLVSALGAGTAHAASTAAHNGLLDQQEAAEFAFMDADVKADEVTNLRTHLEKDDGVYVYDIEFYVGNIEYEYEIRAEDGAVLEKDKEDKSRNVKTDTAADSKGRASSEDSSGKEENDIAETLCRLFRENREDDIRMGFTSVGPHRDDLILTLNRNQMKQFASQGQIRTAALSMKLSQMRILKDLSGEEPVLLLDDVMSELDRKRRACLIGEISDFQTFITCADKDDVDCDKVDRMWQVSADNGEAVVSEIHNP